MAAENYFYADAFTYSLWVRNYTGGTAFGHNYAMLLQGSVWWTRSGDPGADWFSADSGLIDDPQWIHYAYTYDGSDLRSYRDGALEDTTAFVPPPILLAGMQAMPGQIT